MQNDRTVSIQHAIKRAEDHLRSRDRVLASLIEQHGPCTMFDNGSLQRKTAYHVMVWAIVNQQLSVAAARSIENRLASHHDGNTFRRATIDSLDDSQLQGCGLSRQKIRYLRELGSAIEQKSINFRKLHSKSNEEIGQLLTRVPGIGPWTVDMFLMFYLGRLDVLPLGDLALRKAISISYNVSTHDEMQRVAKYWTPYETIASWYMWHVVD